LEKDKILETAEQKISQVLGADTSGHDLWHIRRVVGLASRISATEGGDLFIIQLAAWLHDIADHKFNEGDETAGPREARKWMESMDIPESTILQVNTIIKEISFKGADVKTPMSTLEGKIVQDADRLDAMGAIGIARTFAYGGHKKHPIYDPQISPVRHSDFEEYKNSTAPTINHFYEKLLLLKNLMNTETARQMAQKRHEFMQRFLSEFFEEWKTGIA